MYSMSPACFATRTPRPSAWSRAARAVAAACVPCPGGSRPRAAGCSMRRSAGSRRRTPGELPSRSAISRSASKSASVVGTGRPKLVATPAASSSSDERAIRPGQRAATLEIVLRVEGLARVPPRMHGRVTDARARAPRGRCRARSAAASVVPRHAADLGHALDLGRLRARARAPAAAYGDMPSAPKGACTAST